MRSRTLLLALVAGLLLVAPGFAQAPVTIGEHVAETFETLHPYVSSNSPTPTLTSSHFIQFPGAVYIAPHFAEFDLAPGDFVIVRSPDSKQSWRYEGLGKRNLGRSDDGFFAAHLRGDAAVVELWTVRKTRDQPPGYGYRIDYFGRGYSDAEIQAFWDQGLGEAMNLPYPPSRLRSLCGTDDSEEAKCYLASEPDAYNTSKAVARLVLNGRAHCTGWLVGCEGHLMTNEHCIGSQSQANNIDFEFMAEGASCSTNCASSLACSGTIEASGGTLVAVDSALDYALVIPDTSAANNTDLPATYGYMQLRASGPVLGERIYIPQHPAGWGKRIAVESSHTQDSGFARVSSLNEAGCQAAGVQETGYYADTQGGSSGSPVLGHSDNLVIALHHCRGSAACTGSGGDPNRGVPIDAIIADLGSALPACSLDNGPLVAINSPSGGSSVTAGDSVSFAGTATDAEDGNLAASLSWSSSLDGAIGSGASFSTSSLSVGNHTVTASVSDSDGNPGSDSISLTVNPVGGGGCTGAGCIDWSTTATVSYSTQDASANVTVEGGGEGILLQQNTWRRTTQTFTVTANTVLEFEFQSTSQGEIHGIGFDEDDNISNAVRVFQVHGTQNWGSANHDFDNYSGSAFTTYTIPVGQYYTGSGLRLVLVNDKDAGALNNNSRFRNVRVFEPGSGGGCTTDVDFESGASGWTNSSASTCSTGAFVAATPTSVVNGGVTTQVAGDHTSGSGNAFFSATNSSAGVNDVDGGNCVVLSPVYPTSAASDVSIWYFHGQRDAGDDSGDGFELEISTDGGSSWSSMASAGDVTSNAAWTEATTTVPAGSDVRFRVQVSDATADGDLVEAGVDDLTICPQ
ncbi:MAG: trypsin-like peptidase domain-containing protein [Acidobacteriota bacterium]